jgi:branched-chain amino acid transport system ATP-binding protein
VSLPLLSVRDLDVRYGEARAVFGATLEVADREVVAVLGANGAGKSSLAAAIAGVVPVSGGSVELAGIDVTGWPSHRMSRAGVAYVPEGRGIFPHLTVLDNLRSMLRWTVPSNRRAEALDRVFTAFPILGERRRQRAGTLSGGEQQMLSLARVLATGPRLVIADEMSLGLAPLMVDVVFEGLARARDEGVAVLLVEQFVDRALGFADRAVLMRSGAIAWSGPADEARGRLSVGYLG